VRVCGTFFAPQFSILVFSFVFFRFQFSPMTAYFSEKRLRYSRERALRSRALRLEITLCGFLFHRPASFKDGMRMAQVILRWHSTVILRWHSHISYTGSSHSGGHFQIHRSLLRIMWIFRRSGSSSLFFCAVEEGFPFNCLLPYKLFRAILRERMQTRESRTGMQLRHRSTAALLVTAGFATPCCVALLIKKASTRCIRGQGQNISSGIESMVLEISDADITALLDCNSVKT